MRVGLGPRSSEIYALLTAAGDAAVDVAETVEQRFTGWPNGPSQEEVKEKEHHCDHIVSRLLSLTNVMFVTPFDRDDLTALAFAVDDVADAAENAAELLGIYGVESPTRQSFELCSLLVDATRELAQLLGELDRVRGSSPRIVAIKEIEDRGDEVARAARASLFKVVRIDPVIVIRWKDVYEALEDAIDACETAAHLVGNILVKNA